MPEQKIKYLIVDTTAFIKNVQLQEVAENIVTVQGVIDEIKNDKQLSRLAVLPYNLKIREPFPENLKYVTNFAKKTGDYATLSLVDLTVVALTYELEKQEVGVEHLKTEPQIAKTIYGKSRVKTGDFENKFQLPGFYMPKKNVDGSVATSSVADVSEEIQAINEETLDEGVHEQEEEEDIDEKELAEKIAQMSVDYQDDDDKDQILVKVEEMPDQQETEDIEEQEYEEEIEDDPEEEEDDDSWITPSNFSKVRVGMDPQSYDDDTKPTVACMTSDFAMQNVLKQIGLRVSALNGRVIKQTRTFILRCYSCFKTTTNVMKIFCPHCGNKTLKRVSISVNSEGKQVIHINTRKPLSAKFKNQSLPAPKGGKHACNPILTEDQPIPQQRLSKKALTKTNPLDDDYIAGYSPFVLRDVDSRSAMLRNTNNIKQWMKNYEYDNHRRGYKKNK